MFFGILVAIVVALLQLSGAATTGAVSNVEKTEGHGFTNLGGNTRHEAPSRHKTTAMQSAVSLYGQCGGIGYTGPTTCVPGCVCIFMSPFFSQCLGTPTPVPTTTKPPTPPPTIRPRPPSLPIQVFKESGTIAATSSVKRGTQTTLAAAMGQCGGQGFDYTQYGSSLDGHSGTLKLVCVAGYDCHEINALFFQCLSHHDPRTA